MSACFATHTLWTTFLVFSALTAVGAQAPNFAIPINWKNVTLDASLETRTALARGAIELLLSKDHFNSSDGLFDAFELAPNSNVFSGLALADLAMGADTYKSLLDQSLSVIPPTIAQRVISWWGLTAIDAFRAYGDQKYLQDAESYWEIANKYVIQPEDAAKGTHPAKGVAIHSTCNGATVAGGVFEVATSDDTQAIGYTTASFAGLSAYLYQYTSNQTYNSAAELSVQFMRNQLYDGNYIGQTLSVNNCSRAMESFSFNSGFYIEALSVHASMNSTWTSFLQSLVSTVVPYNTWTSSDGVNVAPSSPGDQWGQNSRTYLFRGLYETWNRTDPRSDMAIFIESYFNVQFNALQTYASTSNSSQYSTQLQGPATSSFLETGQLLAMNILNAAVGFARAESATLPTSSSATTSTSSAIPGVSSTSDPTQHAESTASHKAPIAAIVGCTVGGAILLVIIVAVIIFPQRRAQRHAEYSTRQSEFAVVPFDRADPPFLPRPASLRKEPAPSPPSMDTAVPSEPVLRPSHSSSPPAPSPPMMETVLSPEPLSQPSVSSSLPVPQSRPSSITGTDIAAVPHLLDRLNRIMARLPPATMDELDEPPSYAERH